MKIRDIIIKIANREDVPKRIKWRNTIWIYDDKEQDYTNDDDDCLFAYNFCNHTVLGFINDEVEIIEEEKEIENIPFDNEMTLTMMEMYHQLEKYNYKINELIDVVNEMRKEK